MNNKKSNNKSNNKPKSKPIKSKKPIKQSSGQNRFLIPSLLKSYGNQFTMNI